jgi:hypothetical protein
MRDGRLKRIEVIAQRQKRVFAESDDQGFLFRRQHSRANGFCPIGASWMKSRFFHFITVFRFSPGRSLNDWIEAFDRCIAAGVTTSAVVG